MSCHAMPCHRPPFRFRSISELGGFPLPTTTELYPEWPIGALTHVPDNISTTVAIALFNLDGHWQLAPDDTSALAILNNNPGCAKENK